jgi:hypothetical protein
MWLVHSVDLLVKGEINRCIRHGLWAELFMGIKRSQCLWLYHLMFKLKNNTGCALKIFVWNLSLSKQYLNMMIWNLPNEQGNNQCMFRTMHKSIYIQELFMGIKRSQCLWLYHFMFKLKNNTGCALKIFVWNLSLSKQYLNMMIWNLPNEQGNNQCMFRTMHKSIYIYIYIGKR